MKEIDYQPLEDITVNSKLVKIINFKPKTAPVICSGIALLLFFINSIYAKILAVFFLLMVLIVLFLVKERKVADIYENGILIYHPRESTHAYFLSYDDIVIWKCDNHDGHNSIEFTKNDGSIIAIDTFEADKAYKALDKFIHEKEERAIQAKKNKEIKFSIPDAMENIRNLFSKK